MSRLVILSTIPLFCLPVASFAAEFRIDTQVFVGEDPSPVYETVTLFQRRIVYDFIHTDGGEITIYDPHVGRFILLDTRRRVKTEISEDVLMQFVAQVKVRAMEGGGWTAREAADPKFRAVFDQNAQTLTLTGKRLEYIARASSGQFPSAEAARDYFSFIDMYTRLNATRKGALPPHARLELNQALAQHNILPASIQRTMKSGNPLLGKSIVARSEHAIAWRLVRQDQALIDRAAGYRAEFKNVNFGVYRQVAAPAE